MHGAGAQGDEPLWGGAASRLAAALEAGGAALEDALGRVARRALERAAADLAAALGAPPPPPRTAPAPQGVIAPALAFAGALAAARAAPRGPEVAASGAWLTGPDARARAAALLERLRSS